jgi:hypothetical protein
VAEQTILPQEKTLVLSFQEFLRVPPGNEFLVDEEIGQNRRFLRQPFTVLLPEIGESLRQPFFFNQTAATHNVDEVLSALFGHA